LHRPADIYRNFCREFKLYSIARWRSGGSAERRRLKCGFLPKAATSDLSRRNQMKAEMGAGIIAGRMSRLQPRQFGRRTPVKLFQPIIIATGVNQEIGFGEISVAAGLSPL
jgi:hypothetical protein